MMTFDEIMKELKSGKYRPIYFLMGDETYFIDKITNFIAQNALPPEQRAFNQIVMYGKDISVAQIDDTARRFPMMADRFVVIVKEAQNLRNIENLVYYVQKPLKSTVLVVNYKYKTIDKRKKLYKELNKNAVLFEAKKLYENQVPTWINKYLSEKKISIDPVATRLLIDHLGTDLEKIANEIDKLIISKEKGAKITSDDIEENIGISKEYNTFELQNALTDKDIVKANRIIKHFGANPKNYPLIMTINSLYYFFSKLLLIHSLKVKDKQSVASTLKVHPFFAQSYIKAAQAYNVEKLLYIISLLREYDLRSKGVDNASMPEGELLKELTFKILH